MSIEIDGKSLDVKTEKLDQLRELFPEFFAEDKLDIARIKQILGDDEIVAQDHYELSWAGKAEARREIQRQTTATLLPDPEGSINFNTSENIFIEGENLEVLRTLQKSYFGKVKMIYIDPPYNTGNDSFIYPDDYAERKEDYQRRTGLKNGEGYLNKLDLFKKNSKENGQYHSVWLSMMYPRLYLARNLLREDGVLFVSIDENEQTNLKLLLDEIFGAENFIANISVISNWKGRSDDSFIATAHESLLMYQKGRFVSLGLPLLEEYLGDYQERDENGIPFRYLGLRKRGAGARRIDRPKMFYPFYANCKTGKVSLEQNGDFSMEILPRLSDGTDGRWRWGKDTAKERIIELATKKVSGSDRWDVFQIDYAEVEGESRRIKPKSVWNEKSFSNEAGTLEYKSLMNGAKFSNPKSPDLIKACLQQSTAGDDIVLDFFAGSGTTAQAVLELNYEDGANRKFICVQMPERLDEESDAYKEGYKTISAIGKERTKRVIERIVSEQNGKMEFAKSSIDLGFKSYKLFYSNFKKWQSIIADKDELLKQLAMFREPLDRAAADSYDLLIELLLKSGLPLSVVIEKRETSDNTPFYNVENGQLIYALDSISDELLKEIEATKPKAFITLGNLFTGEKADQQMTNWKLQLKESNIEFKII